jgi:hypothetical protein
MRLDVRIVEIPHDLSMDPSIGAKRGLGRGVKEKYPHMPARFRC